MKIVRYGGHDWLLSNWDYTYGAKMSRKTWVCLKLKVSAVVIVRNPDRKYSFIVQSPDGEILDVGVCPTRHQAKTISTNVLKQFVEHCETILSNTHKDFRSWML